MLNKVPTLIVVYTLITAVNLRLTAKLSFDAASRATMDGFEKRVSRRVVGKQVVVVRTDVVVGVAKSSLSPHALLAWHSRPVRSHEIH